MDELKYSEANRTKKKHPIERANFLSHLCFCVIIIISWLLPYFVKGYKRDLTEDDMYAPLKSHESKRLGDRLESEWNYQLAHKKNPSLLLAIAKVFGVELIIYGIFNIFIELVVRLSQPLLISKLLEYYEPNQTKMKKR
ncbi:hypothetical protein NQ317_003457 [Molorchus minor]|uniref:Uncharacterized protein n=1 Tax=Molorchus minor TaxID=1323400 RepID=A0ABQ9K072_9CUCU|nr:hypothetical protein NQ317_003457 [Molorchus minor]